MLTVLHGDDRYSSWQRLLTLVKDDLRADRIEWLEAARLARPEETLLVPVALLGPRRVVIHDLFPELKSAPRPLIEALVRRRDEFFVRERKALPRAVLAELNRATVEVFPRLQGESLLRRIGELAHGFGRRLSPAELQRLARRSNGDLNLVVADLLSIPTEAGLEGDRSLIFRFLMSLVRRAPATLGLLERLRAEGATDPYLISMIGWQLKQLWLHKSGEGQGSALQSTLPLWSLAELRAAYGRLLVADAKLKSGELPEHLGLDHLVLELLRRPAVRLE